MPKPIKKSNPVDKATPKPRVVCWSCRKAQFDCGQGTTCLYCGYSPIPSYSYPKTSSFYPKP
jgi:hypothetical protein